MWLFLCASRNSEEKNETVRKIKEAVRKSMIEDSDSFSRRKPSSSSLVSISSVQLGFPGEPAYLRRSFSHETGTVKSRHLGRQFSTGDVETFAVTTNER